MNNTLNKSTRFGYGVGGMVLGAKDAAFVMFLLFYYNQVLGLKASIAGVALMIGLCVDAITDPIMGSISDNFSSKYGRRHPFMLMAALPFVVSLFLLFSPLKGLSQSGLFIWMTVFVVLVRVSLTLYWVPFLALGAEISDDYVERTKLSGYRTILGWLGMVSVTGLAFATFFKKTPAYDVGQMNPSAYPAFGIFCCAVALCAILTSIVLTRKQIPNLPKAPPNPPPFRLGRLIGEVKMAFRNPTFRLIAISAIFSGMIIGVYSNLNMHMSTYFWEFTAEDLKVLSTGPLIGSFVGFFLLKVFEGFDKRKVFIGICILAFFNSFAVIFRLLNLLPPNGDPLLLTLAYIQVIYTTALAITKLTLISSIIADTVDEGELLTNVRQEGIYFSFFSFTSKAVSGLGSLFAGLIIDFVHLPVKAVPGQVDPDVLWNLGFFVGPVISLFWIVPLVITFSPRFSRDYQLKIRAALRARNAKKNSELLVNDIEEAA